MVEDRSNKLLGRFQRSTNYKCSNLKCIEKIGLVLLEKSLCMDGMWITPLTSTQTIHAYSTFLQEYVETTPVLGNCPCLMLLSSSRLNSDDFPTLVQPEP